ncbi:hypothetical protein [Verrucomicrobium spinosum]|nr:hypothetical protein [Verrucomicrobium spinosum]
MLLGAVFMMGLAHLLWNLWASSHRSSLVDWGLLVGGGVAIAYFALHAAFEKLLASSVASYTPLRSPLEFGVMAMVVLLFMAVLVLQSQLPCWSATRLGRVFYVHASQAFYLGQFANRLTLAIYGKKAV